MHRFFVPAGLISGPMVCLPPAEAHHAARVLRLAPGEEVEILDGAGRRLSARVATADRRRVELEIIGQACLPATTIPLTLLPSLPKGKAMDWIVQKATELGVSRIAPLLTDRTVALVEGERALDKVEKWRAVALEAMKQCGNPWLPDIHAPVALEAVLSTGELPELNLLASLESDARPVRERFDQFQQSHQRPPSSVGIWIGPEGDFTAAEYARLRAAGAQPISLGRLVLRAETAAVSAIALCQQELETAASRQS